MATTLTLTGESGSAYAFNVHSKGVVFKDNIACVYYISKRTEKADGTGSHTNIYVGQTDNLKERLANHHRKDCFDRHGYTSVSVHQDGNERSRIDKELDLIGALNPPCNQK